MSLPSPTDAVNLNGLIQGLDHGIEAHLSWTQRLLRCALLHESPGDEMVGAAPHLSCAFGGWLQSARAPLARYNAALVSQLEESHQAMHGAVRALCEPAMQGRAALASDLATFQEQQTRMVQVINQLRQVLAHAHTRHDVLTGLPLRHGLEQAFELRCKDAQRNHQALCLAMIDLDHFKTVNDTHGHGVGDQVLKHASNVLSATLRTNDTLIRFGGEEFLALVLVAHEGEARALAERVLHQLRSQTLGLVTGQVLRLTATIGLTTVVPTDHLEDAITRADHALLQGKMHGRDRVVWAQTSSM